MTTINAAQCECCGGLAVVPSVWQKARSPIVCGQCRRIADGFSDGLAAADVRRIRTRVRALDKKRASLRS